MHSKEKIALKITSYGSSNRSFSFHLKNDRQIERAEYSQPDIVLILADIEGNFKAFRKLLVKNKVIDKYYNWIFKDGHLVIAGDCFDRGEQVLECLWLIYSLEEKARKKGGYVHFILGNHEIMNLNGDWRYVHPKYSTSSIMPKTAIYYGNKELWYWIHTKNIVEKIGDILVVHGGISAELLQLAPSIHEINSIARANYKNANNIFDDPLSMVLFDGNYSPFWYRGYYKGEVSEKLINETLNHFGINTIVTGHTIVEKITPYFNGKVINVNTDHASGNSEALLIKNNQFYRVSKEGKYERLK